MKAVDFLHQKMYRKYKRGACKHILKKNNLAITNILEPSNVLEALYKYNTTHSSAKKRTITGKDLIEVLKEYKRVFTQ
jgi:hypothetical protein